MKTIVKCSVPFFVEVHDCKEFFYLAILFHGLYGKKVKIKAYDTDSLESMYRKSDGRSYLGLVYTGQIPSQKEIYNLLEKSQIIVLP